MRYTIQLLLIIAITVCLYLFVEYALKKQRNKLFLGSSFSIGTITKYVIGGGGISTGYFYEYLDGNGRKNHLKETHKLPRLKARQEIKEGDSFLVLYNKRQTVLLFDYPINNKSDFERYVKEFEEKRKNQK